MATDVITAAADTAADAITAETADSDMVTDATEAATETASVDINALLREKNLIDNKQILASFGLIDPFKPLPSIIQMKLPIVGYNKEPKKRPAETTLVSAAEAGMGSVFVDVRKSARLMTKPSKSLKESDLAIKIRAKKIKPEHENVVFKDVQVPTVSVSVDQLQPTVVVRPTEKPESYGAMPEFDVGYVWKTKVDCIYAGIHRSNAAVCSGKDGAYSICLSLSHEEDVDLGDCFTYTMSGRGKTKVVKKSKKSEKPKKSKKSKKSQEKPETEKPKKPKKVSKVPEDKLKKDLVLAENMSTGNQVRVIRGYRFASSFAPKDGYRYDGVYSVEKQWSTTDPSGKQVWKYALRRCDPTPPPWQLKETKVVPKTTEVGGEKTVEVVLEACGNNSSPDVVDLVLEACANNSSPDVDLVLESCQKNQFANAATPVTAVSV